MKIEILGPGCPKCNALAENARNAAGKLGIDVDLVKVTDLATISGYGVMLTPAIVIDGVVKSAGKLLNETEISDLLRQAQA
jgi:small redox-active disulfide protein 2